MDDFFKIYVDQLRDGHTEEIHESFAQDFIDVQEERLSYPSPVKVDGEAYLAQDSLVLHLDIATEAVLLCSICNEPVSVNVMVKGFYHTEPLAQIKTGIYNYQNLLREMVLLETPGYMECHQGNCPHRKDIEKYLKKTKDTGEEDEERYHPFADLNKE